MDLRIQKPLFRLLICAHYTVRISFNRSWTRLNAKLEIHVFVIYCLWWSLINHWHPHQKIPFVFAYNSAHLLVSLVIPNLSFGQEPFTGNANAI